MFSSEGPIRLIGNGNGQVTESKIQMRPNCLAQLMRETHWLVGTTAFNVLAYSLISWPYINQSTIIRWNMFTWKKTMHGSMCFKTMMLLDEINLIKLFIILRSGHKRYLLVVHVSWSSWNIINKICLTRCVDDYEILHSESKLQQIIQAIKYLQRGHFCL